MTKKRLAGNYFMLQGFIKIADEFEQFRKAIRKASPELFKHVRGDESLRQFAERLGVSATYLSMIENGRTIPSLGVLRELKKLTVV